jgi:epsilon-lactone hydrolase
VTSPPWDLPPERPGREASPQLLERRASMAGVAMPTAGGDGTMEPRYSTCGRSSAYVCEPPDPACILVYLHGGGYRLGEAAGWIPFAARLAVAVPARVVLLDYKLAPEHPFPSAIHDAVAAYDDVREDGLPVVVAGDSAGGGLAAALVVACGRAGVEAPAGLVLLSPWLDLTVQATTYESRRASDQLFSSDSATEAADAYLQGVAADEPLASPLFAELDNFPPTLLFAGGAEVLLEDTLRFAHRLALADVSVECHVAHGMQHVWPTIQPELVESQRAVRDIARFVAGVAG